MVSSTLFHRISSSGGDGDVGARTSVELLHTNGSRLSWFIRKDVRLPIQLQRAMAAEAEAARNARAKVIAAEGEHKASRALRHAAEVIMENPGALQVQSPQI